MLITHVDGSVYTAELVEGIYWEISKQGPFAPTYFVDAVAGYCTCPAYKYGDGKICKHIKMLREALERAAQ